MELRKVAIRGVLIVACLIALRLWHDVQSGHELVITQYAAHEDGVIRAVACLSPGLADPGLHASLHSSNAICTCNLTRTETNGCWVVQCPGHESAEKPTLVMLRVELQYLSLTQALIGANNHLQTSQPPPNMVQIAASASLVIPAGRATGSDSGDRCWVKRASRAEAGWVPSQPRTGWCQPDSWEWEWIQTRHVSLKHARQCITRWTVIIAGDSVSMQWADYLEFVFQDHASVSRIMIKAPLATGFDRLIHDIKAHATAPNSVLVFNTGLWDAAYGNISSGFREMLDQVFQTGVLAGYDRVFWRSTTAVHPHQIGSSLLPKHFYFTNPRVRHLNALAESALINHPTIGLVDAYSMTHARPDLLQPGDFRHYCSVLNRELSMLLLQALCTTIT
eukprot:TRINITY_DN4257_c0_g1_i1.p1 TRINITY_DN4257_c0_g1~~TRINITY_DN4257_c0_g1_i1.p1  ORF type:complete len:392 (+),score=9.47 TRINITY_DN4257_c0_g1_i1:216-1391(+)